MSFHRWFAGCTALILNCINVQAQEPIWKDAEGLTFHVESGIEIAADDAVKEQAILSIICSQEKKTYFLLMTRLPGPREYIEEGYDSSVSLFVSGIKHEIKIPMTIVKKGSENEINIKDDIGEYIRNYDSILSNEIRYDTLRKLEKWFSLDVDPTVSVVGILETGVFMKGKSSGSDIKKFYDRCHVDE